MTNSFGQLFRITTYGESHGAGVGVVVDGVPAGLLIHESLIQQELDRRKPGQNKFTTPRKEDDGVEILSGVFEGISTGTPISMLIRNNNQKSKDYSNIKDLFRPSHADYTYHHKYGIRDYRGGGRSSARETAARVAAGAIAKALLATLDIKVQSGIYEVGGVVAQAMDFEFAKTSPIHALDPKVEEAQKNLIAQARSDHNSIGASVKVIVSNVPKSLGEPIYYKLDALLASAMMSINASKAFEIGMGAACIQSDGKTYNDNMDASGFLSNNSGGVLGGISNGQDLVLTTYFKPTPSIFQDQTTINTSGQTTTCNIKGRHDPCVAIRGSIVCEAMTAIVIADMLLLNMSSKMDHLKAVYD